MKNVTNMKWMFIVLSVVVLSSCYKDKGNYSYMDINEVSIDSFTQQYNGYYLVDTLRITPKIHFSIDSITTERYSYEWSLVTGTFDGAHSIKISESKNLEFPITVPANNYVLVFKLLDKSTGVTWMQKSRLRVSTYFDKGWMILGEKDGYTTVDMISIPGSGDTIIIKDVLQNNGLVPLKGPRNMISLNRFNNNPLYLLTDDGTYELNKKTFESGEYANVKNLVYDTEKPSKFTATDIVQNASYNRYMIGGEKLYVNASLISSNSYGNPASRYRTSQHSFNVAPHIAYSGFLYGYVSGRMLAYNTDEKRFVSFTTAANFCDSLPDNSGDPFEWKTGMDMVNLFNSNYVNPALGTMSYALMKNSEGNHFLYSFTTNNIRKGKRYDVSALPGISTMKNWGFSGAYPIMFYTSGTKLYGYNYETGLKFEKDFGKEITLLHFDTFNEKNEAFYVATYDGSKPANTGGEMTKFKVKRNPNAIEIEEVEGVKWTGLTKAISMTWKYW